MKNALVQLKYMVDSKEEWNLSVKEKGSKTEKGMV